MHHYIYLPLSMLSSSPPFCHPLLLSFIFFPFFFSSTHRSNSLAISIPYFLILSLSLYLSMFLFLSVSVCFCLCIYLSNSLCASLHFSRSPSVLLHTRAESAAFTPAAVTASLSEHPSILVIL